MGQNQAPVVGKIKPGTQRALMIASLIYVITSFSILM